MGFRVADAVATRRWPPVNGAPFPFMKSLPISIAVAVLLLLEADCGKKREITSLQRKEAASLLSEAQFALTLRDLARADGLLAKATALCPDAGDSWVSLGSVRMKLGQRDAARTAYKQALTAYEDAAAKNKTDAEPVLQQVTVLALLGRVKEARELADKLPARFPANRSVRMFAEGRKLERLLADPKFKDVAF